ncbi:hypothetical protein GN956_G26079 [Arapaima gigas]
MFLGPGGLQECWHPYSETSQIETHLGHFPLKYLTSRKRPTTDELNRRRTRVRPVFPDVLNIPSRPRSRCPQSTTDKVRLAQAINTVFSTDEVEVGCQTSPEERRAGPSPKALR